MEMEERRRDKRFDTINFVHYTLRDADGGSMEYMGRTLDASARGLLVEVHLPLPIGHNLMLSIGMGEDIVELCGEVVHCSDSEEGMFNSGIEFSPLSAEQEKKLQVYLMAFAGAVQDA